MEENTWKDEETSDYTQEFALMRPWYVAMRPGMLGVGQNCFFNFLVEKTFFQPKPKWKLIYKYQSFHSSFHIQNEAAQEEGKH